MAENLEPEEYRVSVSEAMTVARFDTGTVFDPETVRETVEEAGLTYAGTRLVARGRLIDDNDRLLLVDEESDMRLLLAPAKDTEPYENLRDVPEDDRGDTVHVRGTIQEDEEGLETAEEVEADFSLLVESYELDPQQVRLPPIYPEDDDDEDGWF